MVVFWYILWAVLIKCIGKPVSAIISHNSFCTTESNAFTQSMMSRYVSVLYSRSFQELLSCTYAALLNPFCSSLSEGSLIALILLQIILAYNSKLITR
jgi:hypothetical protein